MSNFGWFDACCLITLKRNGTVLDKILYKGSLYSGLSFRLLFNPENADETDSTACLK